MGKAKLVAGLMVAVALNAAAQAKDMGMGKPQSTMGKDMDGSATYTIVLKSTWTKASHPFEYPSGAHFSGIIGAAHSEAYSIFAEGSMPTKGLEMLSEMGKPSPLDDEIKAAAAAGSARSLFGTGPLKDFRDSLVAMVTVDAKHPFVSVVAMVAPSPDWFLGVRNIDLREGMGWTASKTLQAYAYDSGGDDGTTYKAADKDNNPKKATTMAASRHFAPDGSPVPVATITITKKM